MSTGADRSAAEDVAAALVAALDGPGASAIVCYARCWPCQSAGHFDPPQAHTWMGREDAEHRGLGWPLSREDAAANPCACRCAAPGGDAR